MLEVFGFQGLGLQARVFMAGYAVCGEFDGPSGPVHLACWVKGPGYFRVRVWALSRTRL